MYIILSLLFFNIAYPQEIKFKHLSVEDGLSQNLVLCMIQDHFGFLWFGTRNGLSRFNGYEFKIFRHDSNNPYSLSDNNIWSIYEDKEGNIWIGTQAGILNSLNPETEEFKHYILDSSKTINENRIVSIAEDKKGKLWLGTHKGGLYQLDVKSGTIKHWQNEPENPNSLSDNYVTSVLEDLKGNLWVGTHNGLCLLKNDSFIRYYHDPFNPNSLSHNIIWTIYQSEDEPERFWVGTFNGLTAVEIDKNLFTRLIPDKNNHDRFSRSISSICKGELHSQKVLWVGTDGGLIQLNANSFQSTQITNSSSIPFSRWVYDRNNPTGLANNFINKVLIDRSGVLWIATIKGINYYSPKKDKFTLQSKRKYDGIDLGKFSGLEVLAICETADRQVWFGTIAGLFSLNKNGKIFQPNGDKLTMYKVVKNEIFSDQIIWSLAKGNNDDLWIGTYGDGLKHFDINSGKTRQWLGNPGDSKNIDNAYIKAIHQDKSGFLWIGLWGTGVNRLDIKTGQIAKWHSVGRDPKSLSSGDIEVFFEDSKGRIWIGTYGGGLNLFDPSEGGIFHKWLYDPKDDKSICNNNIFSICESVHHQNKIHTSDPGPGSKTILWIGTTNGLNKLSIDNRSSLKDLKVDSEIEYYFSHSDIINSIVEDTHGYLWITTDNGLVRFDPFKREILNVYTTSDGLLSNDFNPNSGCITNSGEIFIGNVNGINVFYPDSIPQSDYMPPVVLTDFQIFNQSVTAGTESPLKAAVSSAKEIILSYDQNVFSFKFAALDYNIPEKIHYAYKMEGFDEDWIYSGTRRFATYTNLDPGEYIFHVKGTNSDGVWNDHDAQIAVIITPPYWQTWWFRGIIILGFLSVGPFIYYKRVTKLKKEKRLQEEFSRQLIHSQEEERKRIASGLHDSLGQNLLIIKNRAVLGLKSGETGSEKKQLAEISENASSAIDEVRRIAYNLHPYQLERLGLTKAIYSIIDNLEDSSGINFKIEAVNIDNIFKPQEEINLYRVIQECINNIVKHSGSSRAAVIIQNINNIVSIEIEDNGKGLNESPGTGKGFGLRNIQERLKLLQGELNIESQSGGTKCIIKIPVNNGK